MFFSFDGLDGAGKTTQLELFCDSLRNEGRAVTRCVDPGSTELGDRVRALLLGERDLRIDRTAEMLLFMAARAQLVDEVVVPALERGEIVVSDRYLLANVVYQGHALGLDVDKLWEIGALVTRGATPDLTFVLDLPPDAAAERIARPLDRLEQRGPEFQRRLRAGYLAEAARAPGRIAIIDARRSPAEIHAEIRRRADALLPRGDVPGAEA